MPVKTCSRCNRPVSRMTVEMITGLCPACASDDARASQAGLLEGLRQFEDCIIQLMLRPLPKAGSSRVERALSYARFRGLMKLLGGMVLAAVTLLITVAVGMLIGQHVVTALVGLPLAVSIIGLIEIVLGIRFSDLAEQFNRGRILAKIGIIAVVLSFAATYLAGVILLLQSNFR
jgi:hypothetical protein